MQKPFNTHPKCKFCQADNQQTRFLLRSLYRRLKRQLSSIQTEQVCENKKTEGNGFKQLVRVLFSTFIHKNDECEHPYYSIALSKKLGISFDDLSYLCIQLSNSLAETNYQLELILAQIKNVSSSIVNKRVEGIDDSEQSEISMNNRRKKVHKRREGKRQANHRQQQKYENSNEQFGTKNYQPEVRSDISVSSHSDMALSHYGYYLSYPIFFHPNHTMQ